MMDPETSSGFSPSSSPSSSSSSSSPSIYLRTAGNSTFVDPPSYADAIFRPTEPQISGNLTSDYLEITVTDPQRTIDPSTNSHITYLVTTRVRNAPSPFVVRRRFRHVVALADRLAESYRGMFVPIRPEKSVAVESDEFLERRRDELEKYLRRLVAHPVVGCGDEIRAFLTGEEEELNVWSGSVGRDWARMFKELKQSVASDWGGMKVSAGEEDKGFLERKGMVEKLRLHLNATSEQAEAFVKAQHDTGETMGELGLAFIKLIKLENDEAIYVSQRVGAADAKIVATAAVKASRFYRELNSQTIKHLDTLHEYMGLMLSIGIAFSERSYALLTVQTLLSDLTSLRVRAEKLEATSARVFGRDESRIQKLEEIKRTMRVTEDAKDCATKEYERIKENNRNELERFDKERRDDFLSMLKGLAINQAAYFEKIADVWGTVVSETSHYAKDNC